MSRETFSRNARCELDTVIEPGFVNEAPLIVADKCGTLSYEIASNDVVSVLLLDATNRETFRRGEGYTAEFFAAGQSLIEGETRLPYGGKWFFVVVNRGMRPVQVRGHLEFRGPSLAGLR